MGSVQNFLKLFRGSAQNSASASTADRVQRRSSGLNEFTRAIAGQCSLCILDLGPTSPTNISHITGLGHKIYNEDVLLASTESSLVVKNEDGTKGIDVKRFLSENLVYRGPQFDAVLCWDMPDYLSEALVKPVIERLAGVIKPGGVLLAFFHTRDAGPDAPYYRYHIAGTDKLELQPVTRKAPDGNSIVPLFRLQRVFNNRHVENLFHDFASIKFFLSRDHIREVLVVR
jgi:SAM-dependent methyltransferase